MALQELVYANLRKPDGVVGNLVGNYLLTENLKLNLWAVDVLNVQEDERILEIGFGPGTAIQEIIRKTSSVFVAGIDYSELMLTKAKKLNAEAIQAGRLDLRHASVSDLPDFGVVFDKILAVNNIMYWPEQISDLKKVRKALKPGGAILLVLQRSDSLVRAGCYNIKCEIKWYQYCLYEAGFRNIHVTAQPIKKEEKVSSTLQKLRREMGEDFESPQDIAAICVSGFNPTPQQILLDYSNQHRAYKLSSIMIQKVATAY